jgi:hypothetical protein
MQRQWRRRNPLRVNEQSMIRSCVRREDAQEENNLARDENIRDAREIFTFVGISSSRSSRFDEACLFRILISGIADAGGSRKGRLVPSRPAR